MVNNSKNLIAKCKSKVHGITHVLKAMVLIQSNLTNIPRKNIKYTPISFILRYIFVSKCKM